MPATLFQPAQNPTRGVRTSDTNIATIEYHHPMRLLGLQSLQSFKCRDQMEIGRLAGTQLQYKISGQSP